MRVVLDSNLIISALINGAGAPAGVLEAWRRRRFALVLSEEQLEELRRVTRYERLRPLITGVAAGVLLNELRAHALMLSDLPHVDRSPDPADNFLLAMAQAGEADALVTGDKHDLLILGTFQRTRIITARQFLAQLGDKTKRPPKPKVAASRRRKRKTSR
jgi:putative PIN family toxin of toxin-antitoxin system